MPKPIAITIHYPKDSELGSGDETYTLPKVSDGTLYPVLQKLIELEKQGKIKVKTNA